MQKMCGIFSISTMLVVLIISFGNFNIVSKEIVTGVLSVVALAFFLMERSLDVKKRRKNVSEDILKGYEKQIWERCRQEESIMDTIGLIISTGVFLGLLVVMAVKGM